MDGGWRFVPISGRRTDKIRPFRCEEILTTNQHHAEQLELRIPLLGNQPSEKWVSELETLVETEVWLNDSYRALRWHAYHLYPWLIEYKCIEGEDYDGSGLLWDTIETSLWFGDTDIARFWSIRAERADNWDLTEIDAIQPDLSFLANR
ncbi:Hypothetical predicted protein, partial [Pelobates cultripes]